MFDTHASTHFDVPITPATSRSRAGAPVRRYVQGQVARGRTQATRRSRAIPPVALALTLVAVLAVVYIALIAVVMSYGALTVSFSQSVRDDEASVATLESRYLAQVATITATDYASLGYERPAKEVFVPKAAVAALR